MSDTRSFDATFLGIAFATFSRLDLNSVTMPSSTSLLTTLVGILFSTLLISDGSLLTLDEISRNMSETSSNLLLLSSTVTYFPPRRFSNLSILSS